jgi:tetratricopeptide (TPR) repeat protein
MAKKKCFVVMGFGEKPDYATGRTLDLDKTYRIIIKKAVEESGLECIRADDIIHSGMIEKPMYELLLEADIVIADLSTANANAIYELGVRHALRPHTTIVIAEKQFKFPFDLKSLLIRPYEHLGKGIDSEEADRVREDLKKAIQKLLDTPDVDSPVYTFLPALEAWTAGVTPIVKAHALAAVAAEEAPPAAASSPAVPPPAAPPAPEQQVTEQQDGTASELVEMFQEAKAASNWAGAVSALKRLAKRRPNDHYIRQQLALATYKSKKPNVLDALNEAKKILEDLQPRTSTDPETLGLWGAVHKRLFEETKDAAHLDDAIWAHEKGFYVRNDYYNGINLAFVLNMRASVTKEPREALADVVLAERIRRQVLAICRRLLEKDIKDDQGTIDRHETFWVKATMVEALFGLGETDQAMTLKDEAIQQAPEDWMPGTMNEQLAKLTALLAASPRE